MGYSDFTMDKLRHQFGMTVRDQALFEPIGDLLPSPWLRESLQRGSNTYTVTEKARSEFIVAPILSEVCAVLQNRFNVYSGATLNVAPQEGLTGECDFVLARGISKFELQAPLMLILEAKKHDIDQGRSQCAAQLLAASRYNEQDGKRLPYLYGCVTNGRAWHFLKLQGSEVQLHPQLFAIDDVSKILWFFVSCLKDLDQQISEAA
jgi:hypothetical protein